MPHDNNVDSACIPCDRIAVLEKLRGCYGIRGIHPTDRIFILHENGTVGEYDVLTDTCVPTDARIVYPDYVELVKQKIDELCAGVIYQSKPGKPVTERFVFAKVIQAKVIDMFTVTPDISKIDLKPVFEFMVMAEESGAVDQIVKPFTTGSMNLGWISAVDVYAISLQSIMNEGGEAAENLKKLVFIADLVRQKVDELRAAAAGANRSVNANSVDASTSQGNTSGEVVEEPVTEENNNSEVTGESTSQKNKSEEVAKIEEPNKGGKKKGK